VRELFLRARDQDMARISLFRFSVASITLRTQSNVTRMKRAADLRKVGDVLPPHFMPV
jgi:hypothetical protein